MCYTYDSLSRVTARTVKRISDNTVISTEAFSYDAAGNITDAPDSCFAYDTNNRLTAFKGNPVSYDMDGNMLNNGEITFSYDSANRLTYAGGHSYTYNAEDVRIRNLCMDEDTTYTYDTNCELSQLLSKTTNNVTTKYVYGLGLIGEETNSSFKIYHFDYRGSTIAITDSTGAITDTFAYDTYGKLLSRTGITPIIFGYNGKDGVVTDDNGLIYMRARYYSPDMKRFVNADIVAGEISNAITLNRFAYANGDPVSYVDPFGLWSFKKAWNNFTNWVDKKIVKPVVNTCNNVKNNLEKAICDHVDQMKMPFKEAENLFLKIDSELIKYSSEFNNYNHNSANDIKNILIDDQDSNDVSKLILGEHSMSDVGCEVIAVYNAKLLIGDKNVSLADTIQTFEDQNVMIAQDMLKGGFGSNPYALKRVFDAEGLTYTSIGSFNELTTNAGIYVVSFWNSDSFDSMIHTVAIEVSANGSFVDYNGDLDKSMVDEIFIAGYKVSRK